METLAKALEEANTTKQECEEKVEQATTAEREAKEAKTTANDALTTQQDEEAKSCWGYRPRSGRVFLGCIHLALISRWRELFQATTGSDSLIGLNRGSDVFAFSIHAAFGSGWE